MRQDNREDKENMLALRGTSMVTSMVTPWNNDMFTRGFLLMCRRSCQRDKNELVIMFRRCPASVCIIGDDVKPFICCQDITDPSDI